MEEFDAQVDATGLNCPMPILRAKNALTGLASGQVLKIVATDPGSVKDFEAFAKQTGHQLLQSLSEGGRFTYLIRKV
ncbi:MAG: sulfurtransferase TusA family protein [Gammaproteobacteria bacterium]|nr:sulfurtransferase TusA family protein [Gammaproteobacteria bacterium]